MSHQEACAVCGRTFLVGEQVHSFVSVEGRHEVCALCAARTAELGWLPADQEGAEERLRAEAERRPGLLARLFARRDDARTDDAGTDEVDQMSPPPPDATPVATHELETERYDVEAEWDGEEAPGSGAQARPVAEAELPAPAPSPRARLKDLFAPGAAPRGRGAELPEPDPPAPDTPAPMPDPAGRGMRPRRLQPDRSPATRFEQALARFNASEAGRTVSGLTRTLGAPSVSVGDLAGATDEVRVTVAWELTWYQWGVDLGDELRPVYQLAKGHEVEEIDAPARQWNASAHDGRVVMVAPPRSETADGRPVHR